MAELKTKQNEGSVKAFLASVTPDWKRRDAEALCALMQKATGKPPKMWGKSIVGFGSYHYKSERSSQEGDWMATGFSPRKQQFTVYIMPGFAKYKDDLKKIGKHSTAVSCLYFKRLDDLDTKILAKIVKDSAKEIVRLNQPA